MPPCLVLFSKRAIFRLRVRSIILDKSPRIAYFRFFFFLIAPPGVGVGLGGAPMGAQRRAAADNKRRGDSRVPIGLRQAPAKTVKNLKNWHAHLPKWTAVTTYMCPCLPVASFGTPGELQRPLHLKTRVSSCFQRR